MYGLNEVEAKAKLGDMSATELIEAYQRGLADHAYDIMAAIYRGAVTKGRDKLLIWLAENSLKRNAEAATNNALLEAMSPEQRRARIRELNTKHAVSS